MQCSSAITDVPVGGSATEGVDSSQRAAAGEDASSKGRVSRSKQHALNFSAQLAGQHFAISFCFSPLTYDLQLKPSDPSS